MFRPRNLPLTKNPSGRSMAVVPWSFLSLSSSQPAAGNVIFCVLRRVLIRNLHSSNFYTPPFCSSWHAISKNVFKISVAPFLPVVVKLVKNGHFYNVNLAYNRETVITSYWNVRLSWSQHDWVSICVLFPWIPITGILVKPLVMAIWAIYGQNCQNGHIRPIWPWSP